MKCLRDLIITLFLCLSLSSSVLSAQTSQYKLQPLDILNITVHGQPDLTTKTRVGSDGFISFPLVGNVKVGGLTVEELENSLKVSLEKSYLVSAQVLVFIEEYHPRQVSVVGQVTRPGKFNMPPEKNLTLLEAIAMAQGFTKDAYPKGIKINRVENGKEKTLQVNANDIMSKGKKDILLEPDDVVVVPESFF
ncbi:MAG: polysaccharide biosynthesis/export family protein [Candidatus Omnitrophota bacterium]|jgi:polysaccharide export outer membrane protein